MANKRNKVISQFQILSDRVTENKNNSLAIVCIVHNQSAYIEDWIKFHYIAGVKDFYFYIDNCTDDTVARINSITSKLEGLSTSIIPWTIKSKFPGIEYYFEYQSLSYVHAIYNFGHRHEWMTFIDTDEYIVPKGKKTILEAISHLSSNSNISMQYTFFGSNGHKVKPEESDIFAYTKKVKYETKAIRRYMNTKCIIKPSKVSSVYIHRFSTVDMGSYTVNETGVEAKNSLRFRADPSFFSNENLQLNHYVIRSDEEFENKIKWHGQYIYYDSAEYFYQMKETFDRNATEDNSIENFLLLHGINKYDDFKSKTKNI